MDSKLKKPPHYRNKFTSAGKKKKGVIRSGILKNNMLNLFKELKDKIEVSLRIRNKIKRTH